MRFNLKSLPYFYFALVATVILAKNLLHPAIEVDWWLLLHLTMIMVFVFQSKIHLWYVDLLLSIVTIGYSFLLFLSAYSRNLIYEWSGDESILLILFLLFNFYASITIFINGAERAK